MYREILKGPVVFPRDHDKQSTKDFRTLICKLLKKDPNERFQNASEIFAHPFFNNFQDQIKAYNEGAESRKPPYRPNEEEEK